MLEPKYETYYADKQQYINGDSMNCYHKVLIVFIFKEANFYNNASIPCR